MRSRIFALLLTVLIGATAPFFALPALADYCFCDIKITSADKANPCNGKSGNVASVTGLDQCTKECTGRGLSVTGGKTYSDFNSEDTPCDWQMTATGQVCLGPNGSQTSNKCKAAKADWNSSGAGQAAADNAFNLQRGSPISFPSALGTATPQEVIGRIIKALLGIVGSLAFVMFLYGGIRWMLARGNADEITLAKRTIVWAVLGLVIIFSAYAVTSSLINNLSGQQAKTDATNQAAAAAAAQKEAAAQAAKDAELNRLIDKSTSGKTPDQVNKDLLNSLQPTGGTAPKTPSPAQSALLRGDQRPGYVCNSVDDCTTASTSCVNSICLETGKTVCDYKHTPGSDCTSNCMCLSGSCDTNALLCR